MQNTINQIDNNKILKRGALAMMLGASLLTSGCASLSMPIEEYQREMEAKRMEASLGYRLLDTKEDSELILKDNDVYLQKVDGSENRQITHTPQLKEHGAAFSKDGNYIIFVEKHVPPSGRVTYKDFSYFIIKRDGDDSTKREITDLEAFRIEGKLNI